MNPISYKFFIPGTIAPIAPAMTYNYFGGILPNLTANEVVFLGITQAFNPVTYESLSEMQHTKTANNYVAFTDVSEPTKISDTFQRFIYGYNNPNIAALATSNPATGGTHKYSYYDTKPTYLEGISNTTDFETWSTPVKFKTPNFKTVYAYSATPPATFQSPTGTETAEAVAILNGFITNQYAMVVPIVATTKNYWDSQFNQQTGQVTKIQAESISSGGGLSGYTPFFKTTDGINYQFVRSGYPTALNISAIGGSAYPTDMVINNIPAYGGNYLDVEGNSYAGRNAVLNKIVFHKTGAATSIMVTDAGAGISHPMFGNSFQMYCFVPAPAGTGNLPIVYTLYVQNGSVSMSQQIACAGAGFTSNLVNQEVQPDIYGQIMNFITDTQMPVQPNFDMSMVTFTRKPKVTININTNYAMIRSILWKDSGDGYSTFPTIAQSNSTKNRNFNISGGGQNLGNVSWSSALGMRPNMPDSTMTYVPGSAFPANIFQDNNTGNDPLFGFFSANNKGTVIVVPRAIGGIGSSPEVYGISPPAGPTNRKNKSLLAGSVVICDSNLSNVTVLNHPSVTVQAKPPSEYQQFPGAPTVKPNVGYFTNTAIPESSAYISIAYNRSAGYTNSMGGVYSTGIGNNLYVAILKSYGSYNPTNPTLSEYKYRFEVWHLEIGDNIFTNSSSAVWTKMFESSEFTSNILFTDFGFGGAAACALSFDAKPGAGQRATEMLATFYLITFDQMTGQQSYVANETKLFTLSNEKTAVQVSSPAWTTHMEFDELNNRYSNFVALTDQNRSSYPSAPSTDGRYIMLMGTGQRMSTGSQTVTWVTEATHLDPFVE
jgi:hypothetical protein